MHKPVIQSFLVASGLAMAIHLDWHVARHGPRLSLGWTYHWLLALPVFAAVAVHTVRTWNTRLLPASLGVFAVAVVLGQLVEPSLEAVLLGSSFTGAFSADRVTALATFVSAGAVVFVAVCWWIKRHQTVTPSTETTV